MWLPLLRDYIISTNGKGPMIAPSLDVHWVWLVHMLAPQHYIQDCKAVVGQMLPHRLPTQRALYFARERGKVIWKQTFPNVMWEADESNSFKLSQNFPSKISYNIMKAVERQSAFFYQVSLGHYRCGSFLRAAIRRYRQFLHLKLKSPEAFLVPCYDMDLVWHAHQVHPSIYFNDTRAFLGRLLPHDDSVNDRNVGSKLVVSDKSTRLLWKNEFKEDFRRNGAMYRGDPPNTYLSPVPNELYECARVPRFKIDLLCITLEGKFPEGDLKVKLRHQRQRIGDITINHDGQTTEYNVESSQVSFCLSNYEVLQWFVVKVAPSKKLGRLLSMLGDKRFWCMTDLAEIYNCASGETFTKVCW